MKNTRLFSLILALFLSGTSTASLDVLDADEQDSELKVKNRKVVFSNLDDLVLNNLFSRLSIRDLSSLSRTCHTLYNSILDNGAIAKVWFSRLSSGQQTQFKSRAEDLSEEELRAWIDQFAGKAQLADEMSALKKKGAKYFPHVLFHTVSGLMTKCSKLKLDHIANLADDLGNVKLSADGRHVVITSYNHADSHLQYPNFKETKTTIWGVDTDGELYEKLTFVRKDNLQVHAFSDNGSYIVAQDIDGCGISILSQGTAGQWIDKTPIILDERLSSNSPCVINITFNSDSAHLFINCGANKLLVWSLGMDGRWSQTGLILMKERVSKLFSSADGSHLVIRCLYINGVNFWSKNNRGEWAISKTFTGVNKNSDISGVSSNMRHVVVTSHNGTKIFSQRTSEEWIGQTVSAWSSTTANFSDDNCHVVLACTDYSIRVCSLGKNKKWIKKAVVDIPRSSVHNHNLFNKSSFSADGRYIIVISNNNTRAKTFKFIAEDNSSDKKTVKHKYCIIL
ncbi:MAG: F-box protein [Candidatus Endonucleobacter bathymodioli]|uniref:F-box protein n=1 Tax=Candidatus Endonucleibacter bathymodioli TaxID=539814 RepID=A0AA90NNU7_9GAMM|nr:F-box protein [Candidatus Endonucleobacter bathymodioli]